MPKQETPPLSRRERQIMDILYQRKQATAGEVLADLPDAPSYSTVRTLLRVLTDKGHIQHHHDGPRYVYKPTVPRRRAKRWALQNLIATFFDGSALQVMATLIDMNSTRLSRAELDQLRALIDEAKAAERTKRQ